MSAVGRRIDRYVIEAELDAGGFGAVFRARHGVTGRAVALKLLHPSRETALDVVERFLREARILSAIASPHVVQVFDAGISDEKRIFLAMELLEGESLARRIERAAPLAVRDAVVISRQILAGVGAAHAAGVVHRDLKPGNVFLARVPGGGPSGGEVAKVLDFGISKSRGRGDASVITLTGAVLGTPHYMAPEQLYGARDVDARADLYAVAVCLYEMLSGELPYRSATSLENLIALRLSEPPAPLATHAPHLPPPLLALIDRGLARDPDARFRSARELDEALAALELPSVPPTAHVRSTPLGRGALPTPATPRPAPPGAAHPAAAVATSAVVVTSPIAGQSARAVALTATLGSATHGAPAREAYPVIVVMLGLALALIALLALALVGVTAALVITRSRTPIAAAPDRSPVPDPAAPPAPVFAPSAPAPAAAPVPDPPAPSPPRATRAWPHSVLGDVDGAALDRLITRAMPRIERCRTGRPEDVLVQLFVNQGGSIPIAQPHVVEPHGDTATARCVAVALQTAGPFDHHDSDGIVSIAAHLEP